MNLIVSGAVVAAVARFTSALVKSSTFTIPVLYCKSKGRGKNKMLVLNAVRNKIIHPGGEPRVFACIRDDRKYEKNYTSALVETIETADDL